MDFKEWIKEKEKYSERGSRDVISRIKRIEIILHIKNINKETLSELENNKEFQQLSMSVKSQLRRALKIYYEYEKKI